MVTEADSGTDLLPEDALEGKSLGISVSESSDLERLGLIEDHFKLALGEIGRVVLISGGRLCYGGHLRPEGYTKFLVDELQRYGRRDKPLKLCLAWTEHKQMTHDEIISSKGDLGLLGEIILLDSEGCPLPAEYKNEKPENEFEQSLREKSLTGLRDFMAMNTSARILLGGKRSGFQGVMPGLVEEALISIKQGKPLFLAGGYGGATLSIIATLYPKFAEWFPLNDATKDDDPRLSEGLEQIREAARETGWTINVNGLTEEENILLAATYRPSEIAALVGLGLGRMTGEIDS